MAHLNGKVALVTGGSRGIGRATCIALAKAGARVAINYQRNKTAAEECLSLLAGSGHDIFQADISQPSQVKVLIDRVTRDLGRLDIIVNNAGIHEKHPVDKSSYEHWQSEWTKTLKTNLIGPANVIFNAVKYFIKEGIPGKIINVSSRGAFRGEPDQSAYGASKAGLNALSQSMAKALAKHNITVGVVAPGFVQTDMVQDLLASEAGIEIKSQSPFKRVAMPEEVANCILFFTQDDIQFVSGSILDVNGASYLRS